MPDKCYKTKNRHTVHQRNITDLRNIVDTHTHTHAFNAVCGGTSGVAQN